MRRIARLQSCTLAKALFFLGVSIRLASAADALYLGAWKITSAVVGPWSDPARKQGGSIMHTIHLRSMALLAAVEVGLLFAQNTVPAFDQYRVTEPGFSGKPAPPVIKTAEDRRFRTRIREAAAGGPNFAGHFTVAEWGCGAGCVSLAIIDAATGSVYRGPFGILSWEMRKYEGKYAANDDKFQQLEYRIDSRLLVARGCPEEANCASYFWEWTGSMFKLVRKIPSTPLPE